MTLKPFKSHFDEVEKALDCLHLDLVSPIFPPSVSGYRYFLTIVDQYTSFKFVKLLKQKSNALDEFMAIKNLVETTQDQKIKKIVSDRGGEFVNSGFQNLANESGFVHVTSPPYTPQINGFAKRANRTIMEKACFLLLGANLPNQYWAEAVSHATFRLLQETTYPHFIYGQEVLQKLSVFGLLGASLAYRVLKLQDNKVFTTRHIIFFENDFPLPSSLSKPKTDELLFSEERYHTDNEEEYFDCQEHPVFAQNPTDNSTSIESSSEGTMIQPEKRIRVIGPRHPTLISSRIDEGNILPYSRRPKALMTLSGSKDPSLYKQALQSANAEQWLQAVDKELQTMKDLKFWEVVPITEEIKLIGTTWVFKTKRNAQNEILKHKARLCAQGFSQTLGIDFQKTFAPTGRLNSLRTLISFAASKNLLFEQLDIKSAFLNAPLDEEVHLTIPHGLNHDKHKSCLRLKKAIYGLRQAPQAW
ncbi:hypothetical protein O181_055570 [Austropuccinia psidii MF-1]|uniref:Integrase catalytic domain-containing protein n=1 Tax=Austropuccinia psidii MF-1 TaxID=1389203 RepID=A0A9Q3EB11_9BASI|nr:hypothetical protein [Austropuccinia psidii MF-1]